MQIGQSQLEAVGELVRRGQQVGDGSLQHAKAGPGDVKFPVAGVLTGGVLVALDQALALELFQYVEQRRHADVGPRAQAAPVDDRLDVVAVNGALGNNAEYGKLGVGHGA